MACALAEVLRVLQLQRRDEGGQGGDKRIEVEGAEPRIGAVLVDFQRSFYSTSSITSIAA